MKEDRVNWNSTTGEIELKANENRAITAACGFLDDIGRLGKAVESPKYQKAAVAVAAILETLAELYPEKAAKK